MGRNGTLRTKIAISAICAAVAAAHVMQPTIRIDTVTLVLLVVAALPWLASIVRSVELPGGFKIELQDVKTAIDKVTGESRAKGPSGKLLSTTGETFDLLPRLAESNPNLALVALRIEIERRLSRIAAQANLPTSKRSAGALLRDLVDHNRLDRQTAAGLSDLIALGNQAAHGAEVSRDAAEWALDTGPLILEVLDSLL